MRHYLTGVITVFLLAFGSVTAFASMDSCECEKVTCGPCEMSQSLKFYTDKCAGGQKVKSCARPVCVQLDPMPEHCVGKVQSKANRSIASTNDKTKMETVDAKVEVGKIQKFKGQAWIKSTLGQKVRVKRNNMKVYETDTIITGAKSGVVLEFNDLNRVFIHANTEVMVSEYTQAKEKARRRALLDLKNGKLRSTVKQKYANDKESYYKVRTKTAVAGVRGTDFVVATSLSSKHETKVSTLTGEVSLNGRTKEAKQVIVPKGHQASFVVDGNKLFNDSEREEFLAKGYMTPVYKMSANEVKRISFDMSLARFQQPKKKMVKKKVADKPAGGICNEPSGEFNQCMWTCENNPKGSIECRIDMPTVSCVRKRCNANGQWVEQTRIPASESFQCPAKGMVVKPCDY